MIVLSVRDPDPRRRDGMPRTLESLRAGGDVEIVVVDGGSRDGYRVAGPRGPAPGLVTAPRGARPAAGGGRRRGAAAGWLLFSACRHRAGAGLAQRGSRPSSQPQAPRTRGAPAISGLRSTIPTRRRGGSSGSSPGAAERSVCLTATSGLLIARRDYDQVGGFRPLVLMEDVDLARRLGRRRLVALDHPRDHLGGALPPRRLSAAQRPQPAVPGAVLPGPAAASRWRGSTARTSVSESSAHAERDDLIDRGDVLQLVQVPNDGVGLLRTDLGAGCWRGTWLPDRPGTSGSADCPNCRAGRAPVGCRLRARRSPSRAIARGGRRLVDR